MAKIISIATAVPAYKHNQSDILKFMEDAYGVDDQQKRILKYLYAHSGIESRYSTIRDFTAPMEDWEFFPKSKGIEPVPNLEKRMKWFQDNAWNISVQAATQCLAGKADKSEITHLITVSCTGLSAPGLELQLMEVMQLDRWLNKSAVNFMGCYAAIHALKQANDIVKANPGAKVLIVCAELCTIHFQKTFTEDSITSTLLFGDGCAAALVADDDVQHPGLHIDSFYSEVMSEAKTDMSWLLSSNGFLMTLSSAVPETFKRDILPLKERALKKAGLQPDAVKHWCFHPGGKRILEGICAGLSLTKEEIQVSYDVLRDYGNMSSPTILFVLKAMWDKVIKDKKAPIFGAAFGPGLTMESMILSAV